MGSATSVALSATSATLTGATAVQSTEGSYDVSVPVTANVVALPARSVTTVTAAL